MGLDTSHDCWHGAYSAFGRWREKLAEVAGIPLPLMEGFYPGIVVDPERFADYVSDLKNHTSARRDAVAAIVAQQVAGWLPVLPIAWSSLKRDPLHTLLNHSDCDGYIPWRKCGPLADRLEELLSLLPDESGGGHIDSWRGVTQRFIDGLRLAAERHERVVFD